MFKNRPQSERRLSAGDLLPRPGDREREGDLQVRRSPVRVRAGAFHERLRQTAIMRIVTQRHFLSRAALLLALALVLGGVPASAADIPTSGRPTRFRAAIGGFLGTTYRVELKGAEL